MKTVFKSSSPKPPSLTTQRQRPAPNPCAPRHNCAAHRPETAAPRPNVPTKTQPTPARQVLQAKTPAPPPSAAARRTPPAAPAAYRPQPRPVANNTKGATPPAASSPRRTPPATPPHVQKPKGFLQPKMSAAAGARGHVKTPTGVGTPGVRRPQPPAASGHAPSALINPRAASGFVRPASHGGAAKPGALQPKAGPGTLQPKASHAHAPSSCPQSPLTPAATPARAHHGKENTRAGLCGERPRSFPPAAARQTFGGVSGRVVQRMERKKGGSNNNNNNAEDDEEGVETDKWKSLELKAAREALIRQVAAELAKTLHHKVPRELLGYLWSILTDKQKMTLRAVLDVTGRKGFLSLGSNLLLGPLGKDRPDEPGQMKVDDSYVAAFDGNPTGSGNVTPRSTIYQQLYAELLGLQRNRVKALDESEFFRILSRFEMAENIHYQQTHGEMLDNPTGYWEKNNRKRGQARSNITPTRATIRSLKKPEARADWERYARISLGEDKVTAKYYDANADMSEVFDLGSGESDFYGPHPVHGRTVKYVSSNPTFDFDPVPGKRSLRDQQLLAETPTDEDRRRYDASKPCRVCGKFTNMVCAKCRKAHYCNKEHQTLDWLLGHKAQCGKE